ncbi:MAG TPA: lysoplasmalogenase [Acidimicrobiales bacterium]
MAFADWVAVANDHRRVEYVCKPLTMVLLIATALALDVSSTVVLVAFVTALVFSLVGDVFLMLPGERWFVFGLGAFLVGHLAYVVGLWCQGLTLAAFLVGLLLVGVAMLVLGLRIVRAVSRGDEPELVVPVAVYIGVISLMVASAIGTRNPFAIIGASLFYTSDALIAWNKFVKAYPWGRVAVMISYHVGQIGLVLSLA